VTRRRVDGAEDERHSYYESGSVRWDRRRPPRQDGARGGHLARPASLGGVEPPAPAGVFFCGKDSGLTGEDREHQEVSMLALHLLQSAMVLVNTMLLQNVLEDTAWSARLGPADRRALSPLFWTNINPYGEIRLDMTRLLGIDE